MTPSKTLEETVELMLSDDPKDQLKAEYYQLENRFVTLSNMLLEWDVGRLDPIPKWSRYAYGEMLGNMRNYLLNLQNLAKSMDIDFNGNTSD